MAHRPAATAGTDGLFTLSLGISTGTNEITITGTDPAGNVKELLLTVRRGSGRLTAVLGSSAYRLSIARPATGPDPHRRGLRSRWQSARRRRHHVHPEHPGHPDGHRRTSQTDDAGRATFTTAVPVGADPGQGSATILLSSEEFGSTQDYTVITDRAGQPSRSSRTTAVDSAPPVAAYHQRPCRMWRCPHCATPQAETARCWVCHRSSTACGACRHFRRSVAGPTRLLRPGPPAKPAHGDEIRPCWEAADATSVNVPALPGVGPVWPLETRR